MKLKNLSWGGSRFA